MADPTEYDRVATELVDLIRQHPHSDDRQIIFDFFEQNLAYLDLALIDSLTKIFQVLSSTELSSLYLKLGDRFANFSSKKQVNNIEIVIAIYNISADFYAQKEDIIMSTAIQLDLANACKKKLG